MKTSNHFRNLEIKMLGATNTRGTRVKITDSRMGQSKTLGYNYKYNSGREQAWNWLKERGFNPKCWGSNNATWNIMCDDWKNFHELKDF